MSGKFMKGFLIFAVVFFFVVVGLVRLTVVMKRHENAQIAKEDKTLVAPDPQKIQRLVDKADLSDLPESDRASARIGVLALLKSCPRIVNLMTEQDEPISVVLSSSVINWDITDTHYFVMIQFSDTRNILIPKNLTSAKGYSTFGLNGGGKPGAYILWPFSRWLCNIPSKMTSQQIDEALKNEKTTYKDLIQFIPLKDIPPNSF